MPPALRCRQSRQYAYTNLYSVRENILVCQNLDAFDSITVGGGWWESGWVTVTYTSLKELRVTAYTSDSSKYYYIKRAMLLVRYHPNLGN